LNGKTGYKYPDKITNRALEWLGTISILIAVFLIYEILTDVTGIAKPLLFPGFSKIGPAFVESFPTLLSSLKSSVCLLVPAYLFAAVLGIGLGLLIGTHERVYNILKPIIFACTPMPPSMFTPYLITLLPSFYISSSAVIFIGCFWPFLNATIGGVKLVEQTYLENAQILHYKGLTKLTHVIIPAASPMIFSGAETALNFSFVLLVVAEMFATDSGLGYFVQYAADYMDFANVIVGLLFMAVFVVLLRSFLVVIQHRLLFWYVKKGH
jgi:NitT/TauT family transport system permease protein